MAGRLGEQRERERCGWWLGLQHYYSYCQQANQGNNNPSSGRQAGTGWQAARRPCLILCIYRAMAAADADAADSAASSEAALHILNSLAAISTMATATTSGLKTKAQTTLKPPNFNKIAISKLDNKNILQDWLVFIYVWICYFMTHVFPQISQVIHSINGLGWIRDIISNTHNLI